MDSKRVYISGLTNFTKPQDLMQVFGNYGKVKVERLTNKYAVVLFPDPDKAKEAIQESGKIVNYGEFLTIKPYNSKLEPKRETPKKEYPRSKQKEAIISPELLDLTGDFYQQLDSVLAAVRLTQGEVAALGGLYSDLQDALRTLWPGCVATPFGSITTGLGIKSSDADCYVAVGSRTGNAVGRARRVLQRERRTFAEVRAIPNANTPIVKLFHVPTATNCDVTFKTPLGAHNSRLLAAALHADPRALPLAVLLKYWAKTHGLSGSGRLTNYALALLWLSYLQSPAAGLLPAVSSLRAPRELLVDGWDVAFEVLPELLPQPASPATLPELLGGFFRYYASFDFERLAVSPLLGRPLPKEAFGSPATLPPELARYASNVASGACLPLRYTTSMCVQDPLELCHNVTSCVSSRLFEEIVAHFRFAAAAYDADEPKDRRRFVETILLRKPKIPRTRSNTEYKATVPARLARSVDDADRRKVIRDEIVRMFEVLLKIELKEDGAAGDETKAKRRRERYFGAVTGAVWKRERPADPHDVAESDFLERQARITEEILDAEEEKVDLKICLTLTFASNDRTNAFVKLKEGDVAVFREFGSFFVYIMTAWFGRLLETRPCSEPKATPTGGEDWKEDGDTEASASLDENEDCEDEETSSTDDSTAPREDIVIEDGVGKRDTAATGDATMEDEIAQNDVHTEVPVTCSAFTETKSSGA